MIVKALREGLGRIVVFVDFITRPRRLVRSPEEQAAAELSSRRLSLYQFYACPFCVKTRRAIHRLNVPIELRDAHCGGEDPIQQFAGSILGFLVIQTWQAQKDECDDDDR